MVNRTRAWIIVLLCVTSLLRAEDSPYAGPTELQDTFLPSQLRYQSYPESARILDQGQWRAGVTVDWTADLAKTETYLFDGETITSTLRVRHAPFRRWEFGFDLPYAQRIDGRLDEFIEFVETTLNQRVESRYTLPRDTYQAFVGATRPELLLKKGRGFRDASLRSKYQLFSQANHWMDAAAAFTLALPTGDADFGGEGVTPGIGVHVQKSFKHFNLFGGAAGTYNSDAIAQDFHFHHWRGMGYAGVEFRPWKYCATVLEYQIYSALAPNHPPLSESSQYWSWSILRLYIDPVIFEAGFVENSLFGLWENRNSSDVVFNFSLTATF